MATCGGCYDTIIFIKTEAGKNMPCDSKPFFVRETKTGDVFITKSGETIHGTGRDVPEEHSIIAYRPHWATCPARALYKRKPTRSAKKGGVSA